MFYLLFSLKIQQTTNYKNFLNIRKVKRKSKPQLRIQPLRNLHLAVPRQPINVKRTYFEHHSEVTALSPTGRMLHLTVQNNNNNLNK